MNDLLPFNALKSERALSLATARVCNIPTDPIRNQWNPTLCPAETLPWLAWALSVTPWNTNWSEAQKRSAIAASIAVHRIRGTLGAVKNALSALGYDAAITENSTGTFIFDVELSASDDTADSATILADATAIIMQAKNVRSKLGSVSLITKSRADLFVGCATVYGQEISVFPADYGS